MSTKIYYARKFSLEKLAEFMAFVRSEMFKRIGYEIEKIMAAVEETYVQKELDSDPPPLEKIKAAERTIRFIKAEELIRHRRPKKPGDDGRPFVNLDCGWNIYLFEGHCYACVWGLERLHKDIDYPEWAEDYSYWDNIDPPAKISNEEWEIRGDTWIKILDFNLEYSRRLQYIVFDTSFEHSHISLTEIPKYLKVGWFAGELKNEDS